MDFVPFAHVILDASLSGEAATFWSTALGGSWEPARPRSPWAASLVPDDGDAYLHRSPPDGPAPALVLEVDDVEATAERLLDLGANRADGLRSPGGLPFVLVPARTQHRRAPAARWPDGSTSRLVQVCLDCPADLASAEARFWQAATGWEWQDSDSPEFVCHLVPPSGSLQLLVQRRASEEPAEVTLHLDLGTSDRESEAARLVGLGATRVSTSEGWIVLRDPDGRIFCATGQPPEAPS
jgi:hypothetical protein